MLITPVTDDKSCRRPSHLIDRVSSPPHPLSLKLSCSDCWLIQRCLTIDIPVLEHVDHAHDRRQVLPTPISLIVFPLLRLLFRCGHGSHRSTISVYLRLGSRLGGVVLPPH